MKTKLCGKEPGIPVNSSINISSGLAILSRLFVDLAKKALVAGILMYIVCVALINWPHSFAHVDIYLVKPGFGGSPSVGRNAVYVSRNLLATGWSIVAAEVSADIALPSSNFLPIQEARGAKKTGHKNDYTHLPKWVLNATNNIAPGSEIQIRSVGFPLKCVSAAVSLARPTRNTPVGAAVVSNSCFVLGNWGQYHLKVQSQFQVAGSAHTQIRLNQYPLVLPLKVDLQPFFINVIIFIAGIYVIRLIATMFVMQIRSRGGRCVRCGYSLVGIPDKLCPECGNAKNL